MKSPPAPADRATTDDAVLGGRLRLLQPRRGHRVGHDAILLAAAVAARPGEHAIDLGSGVGAAGLALLARVPETRAVLVEIDPILSALAAENIARNGFAARARAATLDVATSEARFAAAGLAAKSFDHVLMNPPFNDPASHQLSPEPGRRAAHAAQPDTLAAWIGAAHRLLKASGTLTLIWRADSADTVLAALEKHFNAIALLPVHGRAGEPAIRIIVRASRARAPARVTLPPLVLNDVAGKPTAEAENILRHAAPLPLARD